MILDPALATSGWNSSVDGERGRPARTAARARDCEVVHLYRAQRAGLGQGYGTGLVHRPYYSERKLRSAIAHAGSRMRFDTWQARQGLRRVFAVALWSTISLHGSPIRLDVLRPTALRVLEDGLATRGATVDPEELAEVCTGYQAARAFSGLVHREPLLSKVGPALFASDRSAAQQASQALEEELDAFDRDFG